MNTALLLARAIVGLLMAAHGTQKLLAGSKATGSARPASGTFGFTPASSRRRQRSRSSPAARRAHLLGPVGPVIISAMIVAMGTSTGRTDCSPATTASRCRSCTYGRTDLRPRGIRPTQWTACSASRIMDLRGPRDRPRRGRVGGFGTWRSVGAPRRPHGPRNHGGYAHASRN
jgi:hypothetical protein